MKRFNVFKAGVCRYIYNKLSTRVDESTAILLILNSVRADGLKYNAWRDWTLKLTPVTRTISETIAMLEYLVADQTRLDQIYKKLVQQKQECVLANYLGRYNRAHSLEEYANIIIRIVIMKEKDQNAFNVAMYNYIIGLCVYELRFFMEMTWPPKKVRSE